MIYLIVLAAGFLFCRAFYATEISMGHRLKSSWLKGAIAFDRTVAEIERELVKLYEYD
jgi:hypothetical protein